MARVAWVMLLWSSALLAAVETTSCGSKPAVEQCFLVGDEDGNGLADCEDSACWRANGACKQACDSDTDDQDADGLIGCLDPNCWVKGAGCEEVCEGAKDEDGDGKTDCADSDCASFEACIEQCNGGKDEDVDGKTDCADSDCWVADSGCKELCSGGADEDGDAQIDCADSDCWVPDGGCNELCSGGADEDADGQVDCDDTDCKGDVGCVPTYAKDVKAIFATRCAGGACHIEGIGAGGWVITKYETLLLPSLYCPSESKGWCSLFRMQEGSMPKDCPGCVKPAEIDTVKRWVDGGLLP